MFDVFILFTETKSQHDGYDPADSDGDVLIEKSPSLGRFAVTLPVTFFDNTRNVNLLNKCRPFLIKLVDVKKHQWYYKKQNQILSKNIAIEREAYSNTELQRNESVLDICTENEELNTHREALKPKIRPVDITAYADYNRSIKRNSFQQIKHLKETEKNCYLPRPLGFKKVEYIDFKKNVGLVGLKISHTEDLNVSNAKIANERPNDKIEVQATLAKCGDSAKLHSTCSSDKQKPYSKTENKTKELLKTDQDNIILCSTNKDSSEDNVNVKEPLISLNNNRVNKEFEEKVENAKESVKINFFMSENIKPNEEKRDKIEKVTTSNNSLVGQHIKSNPGILNTKGELDKNTKLSFTSHKISQKVTKCKDIKDGKNKIKSVTQTVDGRTKVLSECKKDNEKLKNENKDKILDASKHCSGLKETLNKGNVCGMMVIPKKPNAILNANRNFDLARNGKTFTTGDQTTKAPEITQDVNYYGKQHFTYPIVPTGKCLPDNGLRTNNNMLNYYPHISSQNYSSVTNTSIFTQHDFRIPAVGNNQLCPFYVDYFDQSKNISAPITKTNKPESHIVTESPSQMSMHINSNNGKTVALVQNIDTKENSMIQRTSLPLVTARHSNLPAIVQRKVCSQKANVNSLQNANNTLYAGKLMEIKQARDILAIPDGTSNKKVNSKQSAPRVYGMFDAKGNVISRLDNQEIHLRRAVSKSNANNEESSKTTINEGLIQVVQGRRKTPVVINHQPNPINHSEINRIYVRPAFSKSNIREQNSDIPADQVPSQVVQQKRNTSDCVVINHQSNSSLIGCDQLCEPQEMIAKRKSDTSCVNVLNNSATLNKVNYNGYFSGPNSVPVMPALAVHLDGTRVPSHGYHGEFIANSSNQMGMSSYAQEKNYVPQRFPMTYTNNMGNFGNNMNMNHVFTGDTEGLNINVPHNNTAMPMYQPMPQQHAGYQNQGQPIQSFVGNRPTPGHMQRSMLNMIPVNQGLPYPHMMQNEVPMNNVQCAPIYNNMLQNRNPPVEGSYYNPNQSNGWSYSCPPPPPPPLPLVQTAGTFYPPVTVNMSPQSTYMPFPVDDSSSIIGRNYGGIVRKINIVAVPLTDKQKTSIASEFTNPVVNLDDKPANSKLEMLEELTKVIMDIPPDSPVKEKIKSSYPPTKLNWTNTEFSNPSDQLLNIHTRSRPIPSTDKLKAGVLNSTNVVTTAPNQNVLPPLTMSEHIVLTMAHGKSNIVSPKLSKLDSSIKSPPKNVTESSSKEASTEKYSKALAPTPSPKIQNFKRPYPTTEDSYPEMRKMLSSNPKLRASALSKKPKLGLSQKPNRDPRGKPVMPAASTGYSPPILPILTYEKTLEYIAHTNPETTNVADKEDLTPNEDKLPISILSNSSSKYKCKKRIFEENKQTTQDKSLKKISLDEYKKRVGKNSDKDYIVNDMTGKTEKNDDTKQGSDLDLGYDSDTTMIL